MSTTQFSRRPLKGDPESTLTPQRLASMLQDRIRTGPFERGDKFLSVRQIAESYLVSPAVAHQGMKLLADERWLETRPRSGAVVGPAARPAQSEGRLETIHMIVGQPPMPTGRRLVNHGLCDGLLAAWPNTALQLNVLPEGEDLLAFVDRLIGPPGTRDEIVGVVLYRCPRPVKQRFVNRPFPVVVIGHIDEDIDMPFVDRDQCSIGFVAAAHLLERGHQRIGLMMNEHWLPGDNLLLAGVQRAMADRGHAADDLAIQSVPPELGMVRIGFDAMRSTERAVTAIVCRSDEMAVECLAAANGRNLRVPDDIAIVSVGENGAVLTKGSGPTITAMSRDGEEIGRLTGEMLAKIGKGQQVQRTHVEVASELILRESS